MMQISYANYPSASGILPTILLFQHLILPLFALNAIFCSLVVSSSPILAGATPLTSKRAKSNEKLNFVSASAAASQSGIQSVFIAMANRLATQALCDVGMYGVARSAAQKLCEGAVSRLANSSIASIKAVGVQ